MLFLLPFVLAQTPDTPPEAPPPELPPLLKEPVLLEFVQAPYPPEAEKSALEATVRLLIELDETGAVVKVEVMAPAGNGFDEAAVEAAKAFKFSPAEDNSGPIPVALEFDYVFKLTSPPAPPPVVLEGTLQEMATRQPLSGSVIQVLPLTGEDVLYTASTDAEGHFALREIPPGSYRLRAFDVEHRPEDVEVLIAEGEITTVNLWIKRDSYREAGVIGIYERERTPEVTRRTISIDEVRRVPGTFGDPVRVIQNLPGVARPPFGSGLLVIRGANPEDSNVFVDGVEVPLVYHLGGYRSIINASLIGSVDYLPGTYSATYGRATGGVIDVRSKTEYPEQFKLAWRSDFLDSSVFTAGRIGEHIGVAASVRRSYLDAILALALRNTGFYAAPRWFDYQLKVQSIDSGQNEFSAFLFGFQDDLVVRLTPDDPDQLGLHYSTHRLILRWEHAFSQSLSLELQPAFGVDGARFGAGSELGIELDTLLVDLRGNLNWTPGDALKVRLGVDSEASRSTFSVFLQSVTVEEEDPFSETEPLAEEIGIWQYLPDPYLEATWRPLSDRLSLIGGIRLSTVIRSEEKPILAPDPRFGVRLELFEGTTLKGGTGLYHQAPQGINQVGSLEFEQAWSSELGFEQQLTPAIRADLTGFYRKMSNLTINFGDDSSEGVGRAYGMELMVRHAPINRLFGWLSYTLSKSERNNTPEDPEGWYPFDYDQTHILTFVAGYRLPLDLDLSTRFQYVTGNPYTPYAGGIFLMDEGGYLGLPSGDPNSARLAPYYAWDLRIEKLFTYKHWQMALFADLLNVVRGENPEFTLYNYDYTESVTVRSLPFYPSLGFQFEVNF